MNRRVQPKYPWLARKNHIEGVVAFDATIGKDRSLENLILVRGHPLLIDAARKAVLQWRYRPTLLNSHAVAVKTTILVSFNLTQ